MKKFNRKLLIFSNKNLWIFYLGVNKRNKIKLIDKRVQNQRNKKQNLIKKIKRNLTKPQRNFKQGYKQGYKSQ